MLSASHDLQAFTTDVVVVLCAHLVCTALMTLAGLLSIFVQA